MMQCPLPSTCMEMLPGLLNTYIDQVKVGSIGLLFTIKHAQLVQDSVVELARPVFICNTSTETQLSRLSNYLILSPIFTHVEPNLRLEEQSLQNKITMQAVLQQIFLEQNSSFREYICVISTVYSRTYLSTSLFAYSRAPTVV